MNKEIRDMKLYIYDHCPYCIKARMIFGLKKVPVQLVVLLNDDEKTPLSMIEVKMVPILEQKKGMYLPESLDIIRHIDEQFGEPLVSSWEEDLQLSSWLEEGGFLSYQLAMPRWVHSNMEEFKTEAAKKYFTNKKEKMIGPFSEALEDTKHLKKEMEAHLKKLEPLLQNKKQPLFYSGKLSVNDFHLFAFLQALTIVKDLSFPEKTASYMKEMSKKSEVPLNFDIAL